MAKRQQERWKGRKNVELIPDQNSSPPECSASRPSFNSQKNPNAFWRKTSSSQQSSPGISDVGHLELAKETFSLFFSLRDVAENDSIDNFIIYMTHTTIYEDLTHLYTYLRVYIYVYKNNLVAIPPIIWKYQNIVLFGFAAPKSL